jgi:peptide chain release factor subunit 1
MKKEYNIKKELKRLSSIRGSGTELISIYVPPDTQISDVTSKLRDEHGQAANIKSKSTRTNVQGAIDKIMQYLKLYRQAPKNGLAIFCGNVSSDNAKPDIELFSIEAPQPIKVNIYRCDSTFLLEPIEIMMEAKDMYAMVVMDGREATIGFLNGTHFQKVASIHSYAHAKIRKGGQSMNRYQRLIQESIENYYKKVGDAINEMFNKQGQSGKIKGLIIGGPGPSKENFAKSGIVYTQLKILGVFDTGYTDESAGINELLEKSKEVLEEQEMIQERKVMERFLSETARGGLAVSGYEAVKKALVANNVAKLLVSDGVELTRVDYKCTNCGTELTRIEQGNMRLDKHEDGGIWEKMKQVDAVEELLDMADAMNVEVISIDDNSQYGKELLLGFNGIAALLRYKA